ncbi:MAG: hypothetical protein R3B13_18990 [Polyangiaceae bacterium]
MKRARQLWLALLLGTSACGGEEDRPAELTPSTALNPRSCGEVRQGSPQEGRVRVAGELAQCEPDGLRCALADVGAFAGSCASGTQPEALCDQMRWVITCVTAPADAGTDG